MIVHSLPGGKVPSDLRSAGMAVRLCVLPGPVLAREASWIHWVSPTKLKVPFWKHSSVRSRFLRYPVGFLQSEYR